jgi:hypothetical protein
LSVFETQRITCPACREQMEFEVVYSLNADLRPDLRLAILDRSFQRETCPTCQAAFRLDPELTYLDLGRNQWIATFPLVRLGQWAALEEFASATFQRAFGSQAPVPARALGRNLRCRVTFGWAALREKLVLFENNFDDANLEILKTILMRHLENQPLANNNTELRLIDFQDPNLVFAWLHSPSDSAIEQMEVPRDLYDDVVADPEPFAALRADLTAGYFVDVNRLLIPSSK